MNSCMIYLVCGYEKKHNKNMCFKKKKMWFWNSAPCDITTRVNLSFSYHFQVLITAFQTSL